MRPRKMTTPAWELSTEHATITDDHGRWQPGPRLKALLEEGWEPFAVFGQNDPSHGKISCPLVWLRRVEDA